MCSYFVSDKNIIVLLLTLLKNDNMSYTVHSECDGLIKICSVQLQHGQYFLTFVLVIRHNSESSFTLALNSGGCALMKYASTSSK